MYAISQFYGKPIDRINKDLSPRKISAFQVALVTSWDVEWSIAIYESIIAEKKVLAFI